MDISSLLSNLSDEDIQKLKATAQQFFGESTSSQPKQESVSETGFMPDMKMLTGVAKLSGMMNENDERCVFIQSLKPLLSEGRQKKADEAVKLLKFMRIMNKLQEFTQ